MAALRSNRLEGMLGAPIGALVAANIQSLIDGQVSESFDLDFKSQHYGHGDSDRRDLAGDVAALANTAGGLLIIGVAEDEQARACGLTPVEITDGIRGRILQIVSSLVSPVPTFDIELIPAATSDAEGFVVIAVARSLAAPHAVLVNEALRYPKRNGTTTRYLSEAEVATAYRDRIYAAAERTSRVDQLVSELLPRLDADQVWLVVSVTPDLPGSFDVGMSTQRDIQSRPMRYSIFRNNGFTPNVSIGRGRLIVRVDYGDSETSTSGIMELHRDGSGVWAFPLYDHARGRGGFGQSSPADPELPKLLVDEQVVESALTGAAQLGDHARNHAAAGGTCLLRLSMWWSDRTAKVTLGHTRMYGVAQPLSGLRVLEHVQPPADSTVSLDSLASIGPALLTAVYDPLRELLQSFGVAEPLQLTPDGALRSHYWGYAKEPGFASWADAAGITLSDDRLT
jgi:Putative DNA-binding domain